MRSNANCLEIYYIWFLLLRFVVAVSHVDCACSYRPRPEQCFPDHIPSTVSCNARVWRTVGHTKCHLLTRIAVGIIRVVDHRNHPIWFLWPEPAQYCATRFDIFEVRCSSRGSTFQLIIRLLYLLPLCRYTTFIALYPIGVTGELLCLYWAQSYAQSSKIWSIEMPNPLNFTFSYYYFLWIVMLTYIPIFPQLYLHMFALRKKVLGKSTAGDSKTQGAKVKSK